MKDLTQAFLDAARAKSDWSRSRLLSTADAIRHQIPDAELDWDEGVPEQWMTVLNAVAVIASVMVPAPLVFLNRKWEVIAKALGEFPGPILIFDSWDDPDFCVDPRVIEEIFGIDLDDPVSDFTCMSLADLWWETIT